jgi:hypothetical protein
MRVTATNSLHGVSEGEQTEYKIFVGEWVDPYEFADRLGQLQQGQQQQPSDESDRGRKGA